MSAGIIAGGELLRLRIRISALAQLFGEVPEMPRLPTIENPTCERDHVSSYISDRQDIKRQVAERHAA
ncbi:MAG: hypothetical protein ACR2RE_01020, partial [Geminicoccaceae bacterium]